MPRLNHERPGMTYACPVCDAAMVYERTGNGNTSNHPERPYSCESCGTAFTYAIERPKKGPHKKERQTFLPGLGARTHVLSSELSVLGPEDFGLSPLGVRRGQP